MTTVKVKIKNEAAPYEPYRSLKDKGMAMVKKPLMPKNRQLSAMSSRIMTDFLGFRVHDMFKP